MRLFPHSAVGLSQQDLMDVYLNIRPRLERVIDHRVGSRAVAADIAQEMFFRIVGIRTPLPTRNDAEQYFVRIAMNAALDYLKVEARRRALLEEAAPLFVGFASSLEADALSRDELRLVDEALSELPDKCREVLVLSRVEGLSHLEIAQRLGVSKSLVEKYVMRALIHCRQKLVARGNS